MTGPTPATDEASFDRFCVGCGYNLRSLASDRCPECGLQFDAAAGAPIAWEARRHLGFLRAFQRTVFEATFHASQLTSAIAFPLSFRSGRNFRRIAAILAAVPPAVFLLIVFAMKGGAGFLNVWNPAPQGGIYQPAYFRAGWEVPVLWSAGATFRFALPVGILLTFLLAAGVAQFWVRTRNIPPVRQDRAMAIAEYVFAPFAWMFVPIMGVAGGWAAWGYGDHTVWMLCILCFLIGVVAIAAIVAIYLWNVLSLISATTHCGWGRWLISAVGVPLCWVVAAVVGLGLFPMLVGLIWLMIDSLRP